MRRIGLGKALGRAFAAVVVLAMGVALASPARASDENVKLCVKDAKAQYKADKRDIKENFQVAKDACRGRDHVCMEACRATRHACRVSASAGLDAALALCAAAKASGVQACADANPSDPDGLDGCIDGVQIAAFICRDNAREANVPNFRPCRDAFRACADLCEVP